MMMISGQLEERVVRVKVIGVGGAGGNGVDRLRMEPIGQVSLAAVNTDAQALASSPVEETLLIGRQLTCGLSAGGDAAKGERAALADIDALRSMVGGMDLVFILAGLGGGTGSGAAPVISRVAAEQGALVIAFVTKPFSLEGEVRLKQAEAALVALREHCAAVVPLPNDLLLQHMEEGTKVLAALAQADLWIARGVRSICQMLFRTGVINLDFATLKTAFCQRGGKTLFGLGRGEGDAAVAEALADLELCPLLYTPDFTRAVDRLLVNIMGGPNLSLADVQRILAAVKVQFGKIDNTVLGAVIDEAFGDTVEIVVLGTSEMGGGLSAGKLGQGEARLSGAAEAVSGAAGSAAGTLGLRGHGGSGPEAGSGAGVHPSKLKKRFGKERPQEEFSFLQEGESRGFFEVTERNLYDGEDLDVPTYLRRGVKIAL